MGKESKSPLDQALKQIETRVTDTKAREKQEREKLNQEFENVVGLALASVPADLLALFDDFSNKVHEKYGRKIDKRVFFTDGPFGYFETYGESGQKIEDHQKAVLAGINNKSIGVQRGFTILYSELPNNQDYRVQFGIHFNDKKEIGWQVGDVGGSYLSNSDLQTTTNTLANLLVSGDFIYMFCTRSSDPTDHVSYDGGNC
jgi:hypothetical protein